MAGAFDAATNLVQNCVQWDTHERRDRDGFHSARGAKRPMRSKTPGRGLLDPEAFDEATASFRTLNEGLTDNAVQMLARDVIDQMARNEPADAKPDLKVNALAAALTDPDPSLCHGIVDELEALGTPVESLYLHYLAAAARRLGQLWDEDQISFTDVTVGTTRIYGLLRALNLPPETDWAEGRPSALFTTVPGEAHTLGIRMAADMFRRRGWQIDLAIGLDHDGILDRLDGAALPLVGLSAASASVSEGLARLVVTMRARCPEVRILLSGAILESDVKTLAALNPDKRARNFEEAFSAMQGLWQTLGQPNA